MSGERILVVDDSAQMREFLSTVVLPSAGYVVDMARDGSEGLAAALAHSPDLIITDLAMPEMNGLEMVEELRRSGRQVPVILMTAEGSEDIAVQALRLGIMDYFVKPFEPKDMLAAVDRVLRASRIGAVRAGVPDQRRLQALNTLIAIGKSVTSLLDLELILTRVVEAAVYLAGAEEGTLMLVDPETHELYVRAAKNIQVGLQNMRLRVSDSLAGYVFRTGKPLLISEQGLQKIKTQYLVRSLLYVPLKIRTQMIGVLGVFNRVSDHPISQQDVGLITALADYAAIAIANAQIYAQIATERSRMLRVIEHTADPILVVTEEGQVVMCNPAAAALLEKADGASPVGRWLSDLTDNRSLLDVIDGAHHNSRMQGEVAVPDGRTFNVTASDVQGVGYALIMQDITHLKEIDRVKTELVQMVSHEVRSPLTAILSYIELLTRTGNLDSQQQEYARQVRENVHQITETISDLLKLAQVEAGLDRQHERVTILSVARYAVEALQGRAQVKGQQLMLDVPEGLPPVSGNPIQLRQMLINLVDNAIKYTPEQGRIRVTASEESGQIVLRVVDTGIGISLADQQRIFERFYRGGNVAGQYEGTGLGLSIVKSIVEAHDGRVWVESQVGLGTTFTVVLPTDRDLGRES